MSRFAEQYTQSLEHKEAFWEQAATAIHWERQCDQVLDSSNPPFYRWFKGGELNTCYNAVDRHVAEGRGDQPAVIYDSPVAHSKGVLTYAELQEKSARFAHVLAARGVTKGDRIIIYMPMIPETVIAMLGCARLGAVHSVVFGGFAAAELALRIDDAKPKFIVFASCGIEPNRVVEYKQLVDAAIASASHQLQGCIVVQRKMHRCAYVAGRDHDWNWSMSQARAHDWVPVAATDPLYILYTSGTTGQPKGVVRDNGGHAVALHWTMKHIYNVEPGDVFWAASDLGWIVGHSYICYAPLLYGCTTVLYEGKPVGTPDAGAFWRVVSEHRVKVLFTAPTALRAIKQQDPDGKLIAEYDLSSLQALFLAGERTDPDTLEWAQSKLNVPVIDHWWQTETGWSICANCMGIEPLTVKSGSVAKPVPGMDVHVLDDAGKKTDGADIGELAIKLPLPPGVLLTLWEADSLFTESYARTFPGYYKTGDAGYIDEDGYVFVMSRTDDVINVAGHRLSTGAVEEVLAAHPDVAECAVIGAADALKGQLPIGLLVLNAGCDRPNALISAEVVAQVRDRIGPVAAFRQAAVVERLPKTRSGKILRATMQKIANGEDWKMPATVEDASVFDCISEALQSIGYPAAQSA